MKKKRVNSLSKAMMVEWSNWSVVIMDFLFESQFRGFIDCKVGLMLTSWKHRKEVLFHIIWAIEILWTISLKEPFSHSICLMIYM